MASVEGGAEHAEAAARVKSQRHNPVLHTSCHLCGIEIIPSEPWFRCATCPEKVPLCLCCFISGKEGKGHLNIHAYSVVDCPHVPVLSSSWTIGEEKLLLEGICESGFGNWEGVANQVVTKTGKECESHYITHFLLNEKIGLVSKEQRDEVDKWRAETKKSREKLRKKQEELPTMPGADLSGYMPLRGDFDVEFLNDAELLLKDLHFSAEEIETFFEVGQDGKSVCAYIEDEILNQGVDMDDPEIMAMDNLKLKLDLVKSYNKKLQERAKRKDFVFSHGLLNWKIRQRKWKKATREERFVRKLLRPVERFSSNEEHEELVKGITKELLLKQKIRKVRKLQLTDQTPYSPVRTPRQFRDDNDNRGAPSDVDQVADDEDSWSQTSPVPCRTSGRQSKRSRKFLNVNDLSEDEDPDGWGLAKSRGSKRSRRSSAGATTVSLLSRAISKPGTRRNDVQLAYESEKHACSALGLRPEQYVSLKMSILGECKSYGMLDSTNSLTSDLELELRRAGDTLDVYLTQHS